jgi:hypothetical protein
LCVYSVDFMQRDIHFDANFKKISGGFTLFWLLLKFFFIRIILLQSDVLQNLKTWMVYKDRLTSQQYFTSSCADLTFIF